MTESTVKRIPYGVADYRRLREGNGYYVDKTRFIPLLEAQPYYLFLIRPRRFGKTLWLSVLQHYYDINLQDEFEALFGGTYIGANPTAERNRYLVMVFNFALVNPETGNVQESFAENGRSVVQDFLIRYERFFPETVAQDILATPRLEDQLRRLFFHATRERLPIYLLIDEYDNFANTILTQEGENAYHTLTHGAGFFRFFFSLLKGATGGQISGLSRLFITGVSPITMDDLTSGFNIGRNISLYPQFNELLGFTEEELVTMVRYFQEAGHIPNMLDTYLDLMRQWYNHYRFARQATTQLYNTDMALYFLDALATTGAIPEELIDQNIQIDYGKLRHLITMDRKLNGNFSRLRTIVETGEITSRVVPSFPLEGLRNPQNFVSLLHYFGLLTFSGVEVGDPVLRIPNLTIKELLYGYIRDSFSDVDLFRVDLWQLSTRLRNMAYSGDWQPVFDFLATEIQKQTSVRDYISGEKVIQGFLLAYLNVTNFFLLWSEKEMGGGFVDFYLEPFLARYPDIPYGYLIELEYIARSEYNEAKLKTKIAEAEAQLRKYANDARIQQMAAQVTLKKLVLIYNGWELAYRAEVV